MNEHDIVTAPTPTQADQEAAIQGQTSQPKSAESGDSFGKVIWEILQTLILAGLLIVFFRTFLFQNYIVEGSSMQSTLQPHDRLIVSRISYIIGDPVRGDVIVFEFPYETSRDFVKRIVGMPGETVAIQDGIIFVNGNPLPFEDYVQYPSFGDMDPVTLGATEYFVMGDNRAGSSDSRSWGPLEERHIIGKAWLIYYPFADFGLVPHFDMRAEGL